MIYDFAEVDGRGRSIGLQPCDVSSLDPTEVVDLSFLRVVEIRNIGTYQEKQLVIVLGTCSPTIPHRRYVCLDPQQLRQFVRPPRSSSQPTSRITLYNPEVSVEEISVS